MDIDVGREMESSSDSDEVDRSISDIVRDLEASLDYMDS